MDSRDGGRVKNRAPAAIQITAEQLLREAADYQERQAPKPRQRVEDYEELSEYRGRKRQEFEETIRRTRSNITAWTKYGNWEASQGEFARARSVFERALDVEPTSIKLWLSYTDMELKSRNINHARNLFDRVVTLLPRVDQIWYKYVYLEEMLGNVVGARQVFERWMAWKPDEKAWSAYIKLEIRYDELERASSLYERLVTCHPEPKLFIRWAKFEEERGKLDKAREIFAMGFEFFGQDEEGIDKAQSLYSSFAKMETRHKEYERARVIYKFALDNLPRVKSAQLYSAYTNFEKQYGERQDIDQTVFNKRRILYEEEIAENPNDYDVWFDLVRLEEDAHRSAPSETSAARVRDTYEKAVAQMPPSDIKRHWRRYIFLWLFYALFEELEMQDLARAREVYQQALKVTPHKKFTFAKLWIQFAEFEIRRLDIDASRKILGAAIGMAPKDKVFKFYIDLELKLREFARCRKLYETWIAHDPSNSAAWIQFTELEQGLQETERVRAIYAAAVEQPAMDMPELLWKSWIDFESSEEEWERARELYERLLERSTHVKVWISYALFEATIGEDEDEDDEDEPVEETVPLSERLESARKVFERGYEDLRAKELKEDRLVLLEAWKRLEEEKGDKESLAHVQSKMPKVVKKMRPVAGDASQMEEYYDLVYADDEESNNAASLKFLELAHAWKQRAGAIEEELSSDSSDDDDSE